MNVDRRFFLLGSALSASAYGFQSEKPVGTAMIGVGGRGSFLLGGVLRQPNAKVIALCDIKPDRLDKAATTAARDNPATFPDWRRIIDNKDVDAVFIATPPYLHSEMAIAAIKAGKNVYCEKPLGVTPAQVRALLEAAKGNTKVFVAGQQLRSQKQFQEIVRKIQEGVIGDVIMVKAQRHANADLPHDGTLGRLVLRRDQVRRLPHRAVRAQPGSVQLGDRSSSHARLRFRRNSDVQERPSGTHHLRLREPHVRLSQGREDVVHAERVSPRVDAQRQSVHLRLRDQGRGGPDGHRRPCILRADEASSRWCCRRGSRKISTRTSRHSTTRSPRARRPRQASRSGPPRR